MVGDYGQKASLGCYRFPSIVNSDRLRWLLCRLDFRLRQNGNCATGQWIDLGYHANFPHN